MLRIGFTILLTFSLLGSGFTLAASGDGRTYWVQVFAATDRQSIDRFIKIHPRISWENTIREDKFYKVLIGPFPNQTLAEIGRAEFSQYEDAFIKSYDTDSRIDFNRQLAALIVKASERTERLLFGVYLQQ